MQSLKEDWHTRKELIVFATNYLLHTTKFTGQKKHKHNVGCWQSHVNYDPNLINISKLLSVLQ